VRFPCRVWGGGIRPTPGQQHTPTQSSSSIVDVDGSSSISGRGLDFQDQGRKMMLVVVVGQGVS
jgi:hypothetical protein